MDDENQALHSQSIDQGIEPTYAEAVEKAAKKDERRSKGAAWIVKQEAYHDCQTSERGIITELTRNANIFKKAGVAEGMMGAALLGKYRREPVAQITMHTSNLADETDNCSFTFFVADTIVNRLELDRGRLVSVNLRGLVISPRHPIWICDALRELY